MAINRHITASAHQGDNFTAEKLPTTTLEIFEVFEESRLDMYPGKGEISKFRRNFEILLFVCVWSSSTKQDRSQTQFRFQKKQSGKFSVFGRKKLSFEIQIFL